MTWLLDPSFWFTIALSATPLLVAAVGELVAERSGVINIGVEGMVLAGAMGAWVGNVLAGPAAGVAGGAAAAIVLGLVFAAATLVFLADQIVVGTGINLLALGAAGMIYKDLAPTAEASRISGIDPLWLTAATPALAMAVWFWLARTRHGLALTASGENPAAADAAGVWVNGHRLAAILFGACCAGLAGAYLSTMWVVGFNENPTRGVGFLALAIVIFGRWNPWGVLAAGLFFEAASRAAGRLIAVGGLGERFSTALELLPYALSLLALAGLAGRTRAPEALGRPYARE